MQLLWRNTLVPTIHLLSRHFLTGFNITFSHYYLFWHPLSFTCLHIELDMGVIAGGDRDHCAVTFSFHRGKPCLLLHVHAHTQFWQNTSELPRKQLRHYLTHKVFQIHQIWRSNMFLLWFLPHRSGIKHALFITFPVFIAPHTSNTLRQKYLSYVVIRAQDHS